MNKRIQTLKRALHSIRKIGGPLIDISDFDTGSRGDEEPGERPVHGIGRGMSEEDISVMKWVMEDAPGGWVFVVPDNVTNIKRKIKTKAFRRWLEGRGYDSGYKIFVVGSRPFKGDLKDPRWIVHDLVGHSTSGVLAQVRFENDSISFNADDMNEIISSIWGLLPNRLKISTESLSDRQWDVMAGIVFGNINISDALSSVEFLDLKTMDLEKRREHVEFMFIAADRWLNNMDWISIGENKVSIIYPWV